MSQRDIWKALSGFVCVYKHTGISSSALIKLLTNTISQSVAEIESTSRIRLPLISLPIVEPHEKSGALLVVGNNEIADYRYHPLVSGKSIRAEDLQIVDALPLATSSSGVCLFGVNDGCEKIPELMAKSWTNSYRIDGVLKKSPHSEEHPDKISRHRLEKVISRMESEFRGASFQHANVDLESSEAFELARRGLPRAQIPGAQIVYSIDLNFFRSPKFSLTINVSGEDEEMLRNVISHIGAQLALESTTIRLQRRRFGPFHGENSLLEKQINLQNIVRNIHLNRKILQKTVESTDEKVVDEAAENAENREKLEIFDGFGLKIATNLEEYDAMRPAWPRNY